MFFANNSCGAVVGVSMSDGSEELHEDNSMADGNRKSLLAGAGRAVNVVRQLF